MTFPHLLGYIGTALEVSTFASTRRTYMLLAKLAADFLSSLNMLLSGNGTGAAICLLNVGRQTVFYYRMDKKWAASRLWLLFFLTATALFPVFTWAGPVSLLPAIGSCLACLAYYMHHPLTIKLFMLPATLLWLLYGIFVQNPPLILGNALGLISLAIGVIREWQKMRKKA